MVGIAEKVGIVETALTYEPFRVDCEPPVLSEIEDVAVGNVPRQHRKLLLRGEQVARRRGRKSEDAALRRSGRLQFLEPSPKRKPTPGRIRSLLIATQIRFTMSDGASLTKQAPAKTFTPWPFPSGRRWLTFMGQGGEKSRPGGTKKP